jgi:hypothetical protein|uniref:Uncharacterized protein n=1 Tax=viral metagenome TaxID=1070528 RepID=A0A6C0I1W1_9ZZZZ
MIAGINVAALLAATLALIIAFAWTDATTKSLRQAFPVKHHSNVAKLTIIYALLITIFIIFLVVLLNRTNKMYYTYTGKILLNFINFNNGFNKRSILSFWKPNDDKGKI